MEDERTRARALPLALAAVTFLACVSEMELSRNVVPPEGWWAGRGPVVPHDSFPADCSLCHQGQDWHTLRDDFEFDHAARTGVELVGRHAEAECLRCHNDRGPVSVFADRGCAGCHEDVHRGRLGKDCSNCHDPTSWVADEKVTLHNRTRFPLVGAHVAAPCWRCHEGARVGNFTAADDDCATCHRDDLARATSPDHVALGYVDDCERCHYPTSWTGSSFVHASFALTGSHVSTQCAQCHQGNVFAGTPTDCFSCHGAEYNGAPEHLSGNYPTDCRQCHSTVTWSGAGFNHLGISSGCDACHLTEFQATTSPNHVAEGYPTTCESCHASTTSWLGAAFEHAGVTSGCSACHLAEFQATTSPSHVAAGLPTTCESCHASTTTWLGATFDHTGITSGCSMCHLPEYQASTSPSHVAAGFPTSCESCHFSTSTWFGAQFDHSTFFPLQGAHRLLDCTDCHTVPANFAAFSCIDCHEHRQSEMDDKHREVSGYVWQSSACVSCHPSGT